jgi:hypothetical protein
MYSFSILAMASLFGFLAKVYLPAIAEHLPMKMVQAITALIDFSYLVHRNTTDQDTLATIEDALCRFHEYHEIFHDLGVVPDVFSLPCQHSISHYPFLITQFRALNGLCSSITESKHKEAVKGPFCQSNHNKPLGQMLVRNQQCNKLAAACIDFTSRGMPNDPRVVGPLLDLVHAWYPPSDNTDVQTFL